MVNYVCGIDIGTENFGICFLSKEEIVCYRGSPYLMKRYQVGVPVIDYSTNLKNIYDSLVEILESIKEFSSTISVKIEKQVAFHSSEVLRLDGIVFGFLKSKCPSVEYVSPNKRMSFMKEIMEKNPGCSETQVQKKKYREAKIPGMKITKFFFGEFYDFVEENVEDGKLDDICDSLIYAALDTFYIISKVEWPRK